MGKGTRTKNQLHRIADKGFRGYPIATVAYYGPDDQRASKVAVGIVVKEGEYPSFLERWYSEQTDVRVDPGINRKIITFIQLHGAKSVAIADRIIGCPHEEGKDYPEGSACPQCPFWANRDRFSGEIIH